MGRQQSSSARIQRQRIAREAAQSYFPMNAEEAAQPSGNRKIKVKRYVMPWINSEIKKLKFKTVEMRIKWYEGKTYEHSLKYIYLMSNGNYKFVKGRTNYILSDMSIKTLQQVLKKLLDKDFKIIDK